MKPENEGKNYSQQKHASADEIKIQGKIYSQLRGTFPVYKQRKQIIDLYAVYWTKCILFFLLF